MILPSCNKRIIAVDCDLVVAPMDRLHWEWLCKETGQYRPFPEDSRSLPYNLGEMFGIPNRALEFWRAADLYDRVLPIEGSVEALTEISNYADVIFLTAIKGNHNKSKFYFLRHHFPFMKGYIATKEKYLVRCDAMIDDRLDNLARFPKDVITIQYDTPYRQDDKYRDFVPDLKFTSWIDVAKKLRGE